jgi:DNA-directed RNA polymerase sigma subunit (sigma70/sigma32)
MRLNRTVENPVVHTLIQDLPVPTRARRWLVAAGIRTVGELLERTEDDLLTIDNFSFTSLTHIKKFLADHQLQLNPGREQDCTGTLIRTALLNRRIKLDPRERQVLKLRYGVGANKPRTLAEIGSKMQLTRERVRQIQKLAEQKILCFYAHTNPLPTNSPKAV